MAHKSNYPLTEQVYECFCSIQPELTNFKGQGLTIVTFNFKFKTENRRKKIPSELLMSKTATLASKYLLTLNTVNGPYLNLPGNHLNLTLIKELNYKLVIITQNLLETKLKILHKRVSHQKRDTQ